MAQRGMLPKIRKTAQSAQPVARPTIRPVRVTKAPPPPAPPRKFPSGVAPRGSHEQYSEPPPADPIYSEVPVYAEQAYAEQPYVEQGPREIITKNGYEDPPTMSAEHSAPAPSTIRFDDETQMRQPDGRLIAATRDRQSAHQVNDRRHANHHEREDETMARPNPGTIPYFPPRDEHADQQIRNEQQQNDIYDALPSLEMRRPYDTYERAFEERDPETQAGLRDRDDAEHYPAPQAEHYPPPVHHGHESAPKTEAAPQREGSGARERPRHQSSKRLREVYDDSGEQQQSRAPRHEQPAYEQPAYEQQPAYDQSPPTKQPEAAPRYEDPVIPPAPRVPAGFIVGVQPIRAQNNGQNGASFRAEESFPPYAAPQMQAQPMPSPRAMHAPVQAPMHAQAHPHNAYTPSMQHGMHQQQPAYAQHRGHPAMPYAQPVFPRQQHAPMGPVGHQLQEPQASSTSKTLRFAWFVFGVAFGIGFTFFASGVVPGLKREEPAPTASAAPSASFPPPAPILSNAPPPVQAPQVAPPVQAPPPVQAQAPAPPPVQAAPPVLAPPPAVASAATVTPGITPAQLPAVKQQQAAPAPPAPPRVASAPRTRRASAPSGGGGGGPKALPNSGSVEASGDNDGPSASSSRGGGGGGESSAPAKTASVPSGADLFGAALGN